MDNWLRNTNVVKIIAVAIGIMLWVVVHLDVETNTAITVPALRNTTISNVMVQAVYDETQYGIVSIEPGEVTVTLKGDDSKIRDINPSNLKIVVDLSKHVAGTYELPVTTDSPLPKGVTLEIVPNRVKVVMEEKKMKEIPVQIDVTGKPAAGFRAGGAIVNPSRVYISAPASKIDAAEVARAVVDIEGAKDNVIKKVKLVAYDASGNEVKGAISPPVLEVEIPITLPLKSMPLQIKWIGQPAVGFAVAAVQQSVEEITVYGTQDVLDRMEFYEGVEIDISGLREDRVYSVEIPVKDKSVQVEPAKLEVKVTIVPSVTKVFTNVPLSITGTYEGIVTRLTTPENGVVNVTLEGSPAVIEKLQPKDLQALVNVNGLPVGIHELPITVSLPPFVKRLDAVAKATVEITAKVKADAVPVPSPSPSPATEQNAGAAASGAGTPASSPGTSVQPAG